MIPPIDLAQLPGPAQKIVGPGAPPKLQLMAAKGIVPGLRPDAVLAVILLLTNSPDPDVSRQARETLSQLPDPLIKGALDSELHGAVVLALAERYPNRLDVLEKLLGQPQLPIEAIEFLAEHGGEMTIELVATNEERLLSNPRIIELIYMNKRGRMSTANRLVELAVRNQVELRGISAWKEISLAIEGELIAEPSEELLPEDEMFFEQNELADQLADDELDDAYFEDDEGSESLEDKLKPLHQRLGDMTVAERVRRATLGTKEERSMLIREQNKIVAAAAARSPLIQEPEVVQITRSRGVAEDVLRIFASTPEWLKSYQIKHNLVCNAKTPIALAMRLIPQMRESDLRKIAKSKSISAAVQMAAKRHLGRRKKR